MTREEQTHRKIKELESLGFDNTIVLMSTNDHNEIAIYLNAHNKKETLALLGMAIKSLAEKIEEYSPDIAREMADALERAEKKFNEDKKEVKRIIVDFNQSEE